MRSCTRVFVGQLLLATVCCSAGLFFLFVGYDAWSDAPGRGWPVLVFASGLVITVVIPVAATAAARQMFPGSPAGTASRAGVPRTRTTPS
ncbi:hypothetical protein N7U49_04985 [Streptomyces sp. AD2-2]|nr:hypothetical protein N7U49_04985 [Streptomyces sp. AD2-2]